MVRDVIGFWDRSWMCSAYWERLLNLLDLLMNLFSPRLAGLGHLGAGRSWDYQRSSRSQECFQPPNFDSLSRLLLMNQDGLYIFGRQIRDKNKPTWPNVNNDP